MFKSRGWTHNDPAILPNSDKHRTSLGAKAILEKLEVEVFAGFQSKGAKTCVLYYSGHMSKAGVMNLYE